MRDSFETLLYVTFFCLCCSTPIVIAGLAAYAFLVESPRAHAEIQGLAEQMGFKPVDPGRGRRYEGKHQDHACEIGPGVRSTGGRSYGRGLEVRLEVQMREPLRGYAGCSRGSVTPQDSFETAFRARMNIERLSPAARAAMLDFVRKHGSLWLQGLPVPPKPAPQPEPKVRLEHTMRSTTTSADEVRAVLDEMLEVARVIETTC